jgi:heme exporter protein D
MEEMVKALGMGGYGIYVWPSFAIAAIIIISMLLMTLASLKRAQNTLKSLKEQND